MTYTHIVSYANTLNLKQVNMFLKQKITKNIQQSWWPALEYFLSVNLRTENFIFIISFLSQIACELVIISLPSWFGSGSRCLGQAGHACGASSQGYQSPRPDPSLQQPGHLAFNLMARKWRMHLRTPHLQEEGGRSHASPPALIYSGQWVLSRDFHSRLTNQIYET